MKTFFEKYRALILGSVSGVVLLGTFFKLFKWFPIDLAKSLDKEWGFYLTLIQFVGIVIGIAINRKDLKSSFTSISQPKKHLLILGSIVLFFGIFTATQVEKQHRVLSDETSWESLGLMMIHHQSGGVCNEGYYDDDRNLVCERNVNNFKGKATPFAYYLGSFFGEFDRDFALQFNLLFYLASLIFIYLIVLLIENNWKLAALTSICLGAFPKYIFQAQTATTEVLYIASGLLVLLALVALKKQTLSMKHLVLIVPLMAFFSGTRLETVFAFGAFTVMMLPLFNKKIQNLPTYIASSFLFCLPAVITIAAYKGYDFQGGDHDAHSLGNLKSNFLENLEIMLQWGKGNNGLLEAPFSTTQSIWLYIATIFLLALCFKSKKLVYWLIPSLLFFIQPLVVMINVSGTFKIDINQRYVLIALPLFAFIMARAIYELNHFIKHKIINNIIWGIFIILPIILTLSYTESFNKNIHYSRNKLLQEEAFLNKELKTFPKKSVFIYSRPWQMLASGFNSWTETRLQNWSLKTVNERIKNSEGNLYLVRGQDGYGKVNRKSKVVGFKTTRSHDYLMNKYNCVEVLRNIKNFGYPLTICKITGLKTHSKFAKKVNAFPNADSTSIIIQKDFSEPLKLNSSLVDTLISDSTFSLKIPENSEGFIGYKLKFTLPDKDTLTKLVKWFKPTENTKSLNQLPILSKSQEWGKLQINRSQNGNPLSLQGHTFKSGFGTHAKSEIQFKVDKNWNIFHFGYGIDDEEACGDGVQFEIHLDKVKIWEDGPIFIGNYKTASVPIKNGQTLSLIVNSNNNINCDHADWVHPWVQR